MPIKPELRGLYPFEWPQLSASIRFRRAKGRCEHCDRPHRKLVCHLGDGRGYDESAEPGGTGRGSGVRTNLGGLAPGKWRALLKARGALHGQAAAPVREGI